MHQIGRRPQAGAPSPDRPAARLTATPRHFATGLPAAPPRADIDLGSGRRMSAPIGVYYLPVASDHASVVGPEASLPLSLIRR